MNLVMKVDHMLLTYLVATCAIFIVLLVVLFLKLRSQMLETKRLSAKLDKMVNEVLDIGECSDFSVRSKQFH